MSRRLQSFGCLLLFIVIANVTSADVVTIPEMPDIEKQQATQWCWAASIQNVLSSYDVKVKMSDVVKATYGRVENLPVFDPGQAVVNLLKANALVAPQGKVVHPFIMNGPPPPAVLVQELSREKSPLIVMYRNPQGGGHCVVCYGVNYDGPATAPIIREVLVSDPWDGTKKRWKGIDLARLWSATIFVRVADRPPGSFKLLGTKYWVTGLYEVLNVRRQVVGRIWYFKEKGEWHMFDAQGKDQGRLVSDE